MSILRSLEKNLILADIDETPKNYILKSLIPATLFALSITVVLFFTLKNHPAQLISLLALPILTPIFLYVFLQIPASNAKKIGQAIEADIFWPSRMLITLIESGNSLPSAFERVSQTKTISGNYFAKLAAEINLGKSLKDAVEDAIRYTPSQSFKRVLEPIKNSLRTGAAIQKNLIATLDDLTNEKMIEIERYEKRLAPISMFYMIFGAILPTFAAVALIIFISVAGINVTFFPFMFILLLLVLITQVLFYKLFETIRPLVQL